MASKNTTATNNGRSAHLTKAELLALKAYRKQFIYDVDCAVEIGIDRNVLKRVLESGSAKPHMVAKIREALTKTAVQK